VIPPKRGTSSIGGLGHVCKPSLWESRRDKLRFSPLRPPLSLLRGTPSHTLPTRREDSPRASLPRPPVLSVSEGAALNTRFPLILPLAGWVASADVVGCFPLDLTRPALGALPLARGLIARPPSPLATTCCAFPAALRRESARSRAARSAATASRGVSARIGLQAFPRPTSRTGRTGRTGRTSQTFCHKSSKRHKNPDHRAMGAGEESKKEATANAKRVLLFVRGGFVRFLVNLSDRNRWRGREPPTSAIRRRRWRNRS